MLELAHPLWLLLLPVPLLLRWLPAFRHSRDSIKVPFFSRLLELSEELPQTGAVILSRSRLQKYLVLFTWLCLVLAATKPEWIGSPIEQSKSARDLMIAVDLSGSMQAQDFSRPGAEKIDRLQAVKLVLAELVQAHPTGTPGSTTSVVHGSPRRVLNRPTVTGFRSSRGKSGSGPEGGRATRLLA